MATIQQDFTLDGVSISLSAKAENRAALRRLVCKLGVPTDRDVFALDESFAVKVSDLLEWCQKNGRPMKPFFMRRDVWQQAKFWRQSRPIEEIQKAADKLHREGAPFLAAALIDVGPQNGRWATNALPGQSWHQWGLAVDCFAVGDNGKAIWRASFDSYEFYANRAKAIGLTPGYFWRRRDAVHVQAQSDGVQQVYTWPEIDREMKKRYNK